LVVALNLTLLCVTLAHFELRQQVPAEHVHCPGCSPPVTNLAIEPQTLLVQRARRSAEG